MPRATIALAMSLAVSVASTHAWANAVGPVPAPPTASAGAAPGDLLEVDAAYDRALNALASGAPERALGDLELVAAHSRDENRRTTAAILAARIRAAHGSTGSAVAPGAVLAPAAAAPLASPPVVTAAPSPGGAAARTAPAPTADEPDQAGRTVFLATTTLLGLTAYGWTVPTALDIQADKTFLALYMLTAGTSFVAPYMLTRHRELTWGTTNAAWYGGTRGVLHGLMLGGVIDPHGSDRGTAVAILAGSALELTATTLWANASDPTPGAVRTMAGAGDFGLLWGMGLVHVAGLASDPGSNDNQARLLFASGLVGNIGGLVLGKMLADSGGARLTWGDGEVNRAAGFLGAFAAAAMADWFNAFGKDHSRVAVGAMLAGSGVGLYLGHRLAMRTDFSVGRAILVDLGTLAGGLLGAGITYLATPEGTDDPTPFVTAAAGGAIVGFALTSYSLGVPGSADAPVATDRSTGITPQLIPMLGRQGQRGLAIAGLF